MPREPAHWSKWGLYISAVALAGSVVYHYGGLTTTIQSVAEDMKDIKRRVDDLTRSNIEVSTKLDGVIKSREAERQSPREQNAGAQKSQ